MPLLTVEDLAKVYAGRPVVNGVDLVVDSGEIVGLLGPNGAGKTTTFRMVVGLIRGDRGYIAFDDQDITTVPVYKRARMGMGYLAQEPSAFRGMTVEQNLTAVLEWIPGLSKVDVRDQAEDLLERFHLGPLRLQKASQLSGGEQRRLEIARVLARTPSLMLLDEPFANIDPRTVEELQGILSELRDDGLGILITDHNVRETLTVTDRSYIIVDGQIFRHGAAAELVNDEQVRRTYLGTRFSMPEFDRKEPEADPKEASEPEDD